MNKCHCGEPPLPESNGLIGILIIGFLVIRKFFKKIFR